MNDNDEDFQDKKLQIQKKINLTSVPERSLLNFDAKDIKIIRKILPLPTFFALRPFPFLRDETRRRKKKIQWCESPQLTSEKDRSKRVRGFYQLWLSHYATIATLWASNIISKGPIYTCRHGSLIDVSAKLHRIFRGHSRKFRRCPEILDEIYSIRNLKKIKKNHLKLPSSKLHRRSSKFSCITTKNSMKFRCRHFLCYV